MWCDSEYGTYEQMKSKNYADGSFLIICSME